MGCYHFGIYDYVRGKDVLSRRLPEFAQKSSKNVKFPETTDSNLPPFFLMGSDKYLDMISSCITSIYYNGGIQPKIYLIEDTEGFTEKSLKAYNLLQENVKIIKNEETEALVLRHLPTEKYPTLRNLRDNYFYIRKFIDFNLISPGWKVFIDSDTLFLSEPVEALEFMRDEICFSQIDVGGIEKPFLSFPEADILEATGLSELKASSCNSGFIHVNSSDIDWDYMESLLKILIDKQGGLHNIKGARFHVIEQVVYAILFSHLENFKYLPSDQYTVLPKYNKIKKPQHPFNHYIPSSRRFFAYNAVNDVFKRNSLV